MFMTIIETLTDNGRGIHAYANAAKTAFAQAKAHPDHAVAFYLLGKIAEEFVDRHERLPLSTEELSQFFERYSGAAASLETAQKSGDATKVLAVLNTISAQESTVI